MNSLFRDHSGAGAANYSPGRMAPISAFNFLCLGLALISLRFPKKTGWAHALAGSAAFTSLLAIVGYFYGVASLYQGGSFHGGGLAHGHRFLSRFCIGISCATSHYGVMRVITSAGTSGQARAQIRPCLRLFSPFSWVGCAWVGDAPRLVHSGVRRRPPRHGGLPPPLPPSSWIGAGTLRKSEIKEERVKESLRRAHVDLEDRCARTHQGARHRQ